MPRYYFHLHTAHGTLIEDDQGVHLSDIDEACDQAQVAAKSLRADADLVGCDYSGSYFEMVSAGTDASLMVPAHVTAKA
jgi:hypothetical protein